MQWRMYEGHPKVAFSRCCYVATRGPGAKLTGDGCGRLAAGQAGLRIRKNVAYLLEMSVAEWRESNHTSPRDCQVLKFLT